MEGRKVQKVWKNGPTTVLSLPQDWVKGQEETTKRPLECVVLRYDDKELIVRPYPEEIEQGDSK